MTQTLAIKHDLFGLARSLSEALAESPELLAYRQSEDRLLADPEALTLINRYEAAKRRVKLSKNAPREEQAVLVEAFLEIEEAFNAHEKIQTYWQARERLDQLIDHLNRIITFPITGAEAPKERGGCGSGGGGCGCG